MKWNESLNRVLAIVSFGLGLCVMAQGASKYQVLHPFGKGSDGAGLWSSVTFDKKGGLYGATSGGGPNGQGIVFMLMPRTNGTW